MPENPNSTGDLESEGHPPGIAVWLASHRPMPQTHRTYVSAMNVWTTWCAGRGHDPEKPDRVIAEAFATHLSTTPTDKTGRPRSSRTQAKILAAVSSLCDRLMYDGNIDRNPFDVVDRPRAGSGTTHALSASEAQRVLDAAARVGDREAAVVRLLIDTGARAMTVLGARVEHLRVSDGRIEAIVPIKGGTDELIQFSEAGAQAVERLRGQRTEGPLVVSAYGKPLGPDGLADMLRKVARVAGIERLTPHMFRATFATLAAEKDVRVEDIQAQLRHKHIETTLGYVRRLDERKRARRAVDAVSGAVGAPA
jgi:integrase/recombinase XerD